MSFSSGKPHPIRKNSKDEITSKFGKIEILQKEEEFQKGKSKKLLKAFKWTSQILKGLGGGHRIKR